MLLPCCVCSPLTCHSLSVRLTQSRLWIAGFASTEPLTFQNWRARYALASSKGDDSSDVKVSRAKLPKLQIRNMALVE